MIILLKEEMHEKLDKKQLIIIRMSDLPKFNLFSKKLYD